MKLTPPNLKVALDRSRRREEADSRFHAPPPPYVGGYTGRMRGVALVITLIMLAVITFMTVTFLTMSTREKGAVTTATDQTMARLAAEAGLERAKAELLAGILSTTNPANYGLLVSTNYINIGGFDPGAIDQRTNVNFEYKSTTAGGGVLNAADRLQNLANLLYDPRVPVAITNRAFPNSNDFRYYLDLNRNRRHDRSGLWPVTNELGQAVSLPGGNFVSNYFVGDPEWIGGLERPDLTHSSTNKFLYRYAFIAVPTGKTLDVNYIHNQALAAASGTMNAFGYDFFRNEGVGSWEINLAAFLTDLNTNDSGAYGWGPLGAAGYAFDQLVPQVSGNAFVDAGALYRYRLNGNQTNNTYTLRTFNSLYNVPPFAPAPANAFVQDMIDGYNNGPLLLSSNYWGLLTDNDQPNLPWVGADSRFHFFTMQDLFDPNKTGQSFAGRLAAAGTNISSYDQYTFYRLAEQLGTDSAPEDPGKLNLNYVNIGGLSATNFVSWGDPDLLNGNPSRDIPRFDVSGPVLFFTNVVNRLLAHYTQAWLETDANYYTNFFGRTNGFDGTAIPVLVSNRFVYSPSVHRLVKLAANIYQAKSADRLPAVFRPIFFRDANGVSISGFEQVPTNNLVNNFLTPPIDIAALPLGSDLKTNIYGVPWILGAVKGLPAFNEVALHSVFQITRKLEIVRSTLTAPRSSWVTNSLHVLSISNAIAVEAWNSYRADYANPFVIQVHGDVVMVLTNELGQVVTGVLPATGIPLITNTPTPITLWPGTGAGTEPSLSSIIVPLRTNITFLPESVYRTNGNRFLPASDNLAFESGFNFPAHWGLTTSVRLQFIMRDKDADGPIIDYVQLDELNGVRNLSEELRAENPPLGNPGGLSIYKQMWRTNPVAGGFPEGVYNQIKVSLDDSDNNISADWSGYDFGKHTSKAFEIAYFMALFKLDTGKYPDLVNTSRVQQVPFTPSKRTAQKLSWQVNDPLVHFTVGDLGDESPTNGITTESLKTPVQLLPNIGRVNERYEPWGGNPAKTGGPTVVFAADPNQFKMAIKDPFLRTSDDWQFPTNLLPNIGWLGRIHRGTPWQTIYMKADDLNVTRVTPLATNLSMWRDSYTNAIGQKVAGDWAKWSGNNNLYDAYFTRPASDRGMFDLFTTAINDNAVRGQLSVNQPGLAAWSAVLGGVVALENVATSNVPVLRPVIIPPAGAYNSSGDPTNWPAVSRIVAGINATRANTSLFPSGSFQHLGDILAVPELSSGYPVFVPQSADPKNGWYFWTNNSPFLELNTPNVTNGVVSQLPPRTKQEQFTLNDAAVEWLPQQIMSLLRLGEPRFVIYSYGQALRPADSSVYTAGGPFFGMVTNYQIAAEVAMRAVVRVDGSPDPSKTNAFLLPSKRYPPRIVVESFNLLPPD